MTGKRKRKPSKGRSTRSFLYQPAPVQEALNAAKTLCPKPPPGETDIIRASGLPMGAVLREVKR